MFEVAQTIDLPRTQGNRCCSSTLSILLSLWNIPVVLSPDPVLGWPSAPPRSVNFKQDRPYELLGVFKKKTPNKKTKHNSKTKSNPKTHKMLIDEIRTTDFNFVKHE